MLGRVDGRVYYNLVNWYRALALLPGFSANRAYMETMMGVCEPLPPEMADAHRPAAGDAASRACANMLASPASALRPGLRRRSG